MFLSAPVHLAMRDQPQRLPGLSLHDRVLEHIGAHDRIGAEGSKVQFRRHRVLLHAVRVWRAAVTGRTPGVARGTLPTTQVG